MFDWVAADQVAIENLVDRLFGHVGVEDRSRKDIHRWPKIASVAAGRGDDVDFRVQASLADDALQPRQRQCAPALPAVRPEADVDAIPSRRVVATERRASISA